MAKVRTMLVSSLSLCLVVTVSSCTSIRGGGGGRVDLLSTGLTGWQQIGGRAGAWQYKDGLLFTEGRASWLSTVRRYDDFNLSLEFKIAPGASSGVFVRAPHQGDPAYEGMEVQILDDYAEQHEHLGADQYTGSIYDVQAPSERASKSADEWQKLVIRCQGPIVKVVLNGKKVVDTDLNYFPYKHAAHPGLARSAGYIGLQSDDGRVEFRNVRIEPL